MPRYRLSEQLPIQAEMFDVVIVDEASQTGIDGLFLRYIAKKVIIVGDDQQISPYGIGIEDADIVRLQQQYLNDFILQNQLDQKTSLYDIFEVLLYGDSKIVLREHFRCMPEIIRFSNALCYEPRDTPLIPLRTYPPDRLEPIIARYVENGRQEESSSSARNIPEAERIVEQITASVKDPRYKDKTFGVVSLLGSRQAEEIQTRLIEKIGPEEMESRQLVCGDAYAFQGDERDVMFLSLVSAPNVGRIRAQTDKAAVQRFNVAASRAKDQMWLFHSAKPEHLSSNPDCVRRKLLEYCLNPQQQVLSISGIDVKKLRASAADPYRGQTSVPEPFDSWFEVDVFLKIHERGYRVVPQVAFAGYRIDLVVEGSQGRLAVECDGDYWHGLEEYEKDMARQRQLERSGWEFVRIRGSSFYLNPDAALTPLWAELGQRGVYPMQSSNAGCTLSPATSAEPGFETTPSPHIDIDEATTEHDDELEKKVAHEAAEAPENVDISETRADEETELASPSKRVRIPVNDSPTSEADNGTIVANSSSSGESVTAVDMENIRFTMQIPANTWFALSSWARQNNHFQGRERSILYSIGTRVSERREVSRRQAYHAVRLYTRALELGFTDILNVNDSFREEG